MNFQVSTKTQGHEMVVAFQGSLTIANAALPDLQVADAERFHIELEPFAAINSVGIIQMMKWLHKLEGAPIEVHHAPKFFVDQLNMIRGFLPQSARVKSFYVPYFCEETGQGTQVLYQDGIEFSFSPEGLNLRHPQIHDEAGNRYELDVIDGKYFRFLEG